MARAKRGGHGWDYIALSGLGAEQGEAREIDTRQDTFTKYTLELVTLGIGNLTVHAVHAVHVRFRSKGGTNHTHDSVPAGYHSQGPLHT